MIYIENHAIKRCNSRFPEINKKHINEYIIIAAIDGKRIQHKMKKNISASIYHNMVLIIKTYGKDEYVITVLDKNKKTINWWNN
jgi:hypothetical protein